MIKEHCPTVIAIVCTLILISLIVWYFLFKDGTSSDCNLRDVYGNIMPYCQCPPGTIHNKKRGICERVCREGYVFNIESKQCIQCLSGEKEEANKCIKVCEEGAVWDKKRGACFKCRGDQYAYHDRCLCKKGVLDRHTDECLSLNEILDKADRG